MGLFTDDLVQRIARDYIGKMLGEYKVERLHRVGGTSIVFVGTKNAQSAAIKVYAKDLFDSSGAELERISRQVEKKHLQHPNLVRTYESGVCPDGGYHFLVMDFVGDPTITEIVNELTSDQIRSIIEQTAKAAIFIHETLQLVHRDIKPDNVAVRKGDNHVTLLDLGLVRPVEGATVTDQGSMHIKGTKRYAPPELIDNNVQLDDEGWLAVTYYQLGATLYEMLTGKQPFAEYEGDELLQAIRYTALAIDTPEAPPDLIKLSLDCLTKDPKRRLLLVNWHRFLNAPKAATQLDELSDLLATLPKAAGSKVAFADGAEERQRLKKVLAEVSHDVELSIRSFLSGKERLFPGYTITRWEEVEADRGCVFRVETDFAGLAPPVYAYSVILTEVTDASSRSCICKLSTSTGVPEAPLDFDSFRTVYQGTFVQAEYKRTLGNELARDFKTVLSEQR